MAIVKGTGADGNIQAFPDVFSRHGMPARRHSDNGALFNGKDSHLLQQHLRRNEYLRQHRATPHSTMEKSPAELLFGRRYKDVRSREHTNKYLEDTVTPGSPSSASR